MLRVFVALISAVIPAKAAFHLFDIQEIYSNSDGSVQFVELFTTTDSQQFVSGHTLRLEQISPLATLDTFTFPTNGPSPTSNKTYLIGTSTLDSLYGLTPDFILPANFLNVTGGFSNKRLNFAESTDIVNLGLLPLDGVKSLDGIVSNASASVSAVNEQATPTNHAGQTVVIPEPGSVGLVTIGALALGCAIFGRRRR